ncbi:MULTISPECIES: glycoside hydrolase family 104 protein [unclassified Cyanobium]|uniref:glycoside hydrolase family 24 protein n=1 Tax=unclassified Cyanobium TaxID=2627006 RepID=UPI0020CD81FF|nr:MULTISPECIES: glycoside hydrolase family 104 protein [unclassified Cyanobium]MCP9834567.1 glycoside hydrolase family 104 protein [Cyanobium sp. La Preciosa 7G6]MCP9937330.1 glycoside hydrolase family 104 protein [Cyanobium sp. Aljojuca 7A6]
MRRPFLPPPPPHQHGPLALVLLLMLPMLQRPVAPVPQPVAPAAAQSAARPIAQPALAAATGPYGVTPERRALLNTIRFAEGTWIGGSQEGYRVLYGGDRFGDLSRHPDIVVRRRYASAAAGAYQFLPTTWDQAAEELQLRDFRPASQDQAALHLVQERGALQSFDRHGLTAEVLARLAPEWASLPTLEGVSHYGQPVKDRRELQKFYQRELERLRRLTSA